MKAATSVLVSGVFLFTGCRVAHDVAVTSFRVIDAPANYVRRHIAEPQDTSTTTTTTTTVASDSVTPGRPVDVSETRPTQRTRVTADREASPTASQRTVRTTNATKPKASPSPASRTASSQPSQFPSAKPVPGKAGYVFSPFDPNGGYVDVSGYPSGSKVKDPYSGKVFLVP